MSESSSSSENRASNQLMVATEAIDEVEHPVIRLSNTNRELRSRTTSPTHNATMSADCTISKTVVGRTEPAISLTTTADTQSNNAAMAVSFMDPPLGGRPQECATHAQTDNEHQLDPSTAAASLGDHRESDLEETESFESTEGHKLPSVPLLKNKSSESFTKMSVTTLTSAPSKTPSKKNQKKPSKNVPKEGQSTGRWTDDEHQAFLQGLHRYGREWKKVASHIPTRTSAQVRSHAQKYFAKLQKEEDSWTSGFSGGSGEITGYGANAAASYEGTSGYSVGSEAAAAAAPVSNAVQANVARILANPENLEAEVESTLQQLRERYQQLQRRLEQTSSSSPDGPSRKRRSPHPVIANDDQSSVTSLSASLQNEELIALSVLRGALPRGDASIGASELSEDIMEAESQHTDSTDSVSKKAKLD